MGTHLDRVLQPVVSDWRCMIDGEVRSTNCKYVPVTQSGGITPAVYAKLLRSKPIVVCMSRAVLIRPVRIPLYH